MHLQPLKIMLLIVTLIILSACSEKDDSYEFTKKNLIESNEDFIENYGGNPFYETYYGTLTVTPHDNNTSTVTSSEGRFTQKYLNKEFVAFRINKNLPLEPEDGYCFSNIISSRYSKVIEVIDKNTLVVDFAYNGGNIDNPHVSTNASGYFFFDNRQAFINAITSSDRNETITLHQDSVYVTKFAWDVITPSNIILKTQKGFTKKARIKLSAEDLIGGHTDIGRWFNLNDDNYDIKFKNINLIGPHYTVPTVSGSFASGFFGGNKYTVQSARTLEIYGSDDWVEYYELRDAGLLQYLPDGYNFVGPGFISGILYGGKHDDVDVTDFIYLNCINTSMHLLTFSSMKSNVSAGIYKRIIGESPEHMSEIVEQDIPENVINPVKLAGDNTFETKIMFVDDDLIPGNKKIKITGEGSWQQVANQYWDSGVSIGNIYSKIIVDGYEIQLDNNGDWRNFFDDDKGYYSIENSQYARAFEQIPSVGDVINIGDFINNKDKAMLTSNHDIELWGISVQVGDILNVEGVNYEIMSKKLVSHAINKTRGNIHTTVLTLDKTLPSSFSSFTIEKSQGESLLTGEHTMRFVYERDYLGHLMYGDFNFPFHYENVILKGFIRGSDKPTDENGDGIPRLYKLPKPMDNGYAKQYVNVIYEDDDPSPYMWGSSTLQQRALAEGKDKAYYSILIKGPYTKIPRMYVNGENQDKVKLVDNPDVSGARLLNPIVVGSLKADKFELEINNERDITIDTLDMKQTGSGHGSLSIITDGAQLHIKNFISHPSSDGNEKYAALLINNKYAHFSQDASEARTNLRIDSGIGYIGIYDDSTAPNINYSIDITNWVPKPYQYAPLTQLFSFASNNSIADYSDFCNKIRIFDQSATSIVSECQ